MKKRKIYLASFFVALFLLVLTGCSQKSQEIPTKKVTVSLSNTKTIPTFFFHGWGSSIWQMRLKRPVRLIPLFKLT